MEIRNSHTGKWSIFQADLNEKINLMYSRCYKIPVVIPILEILRGGCGLPWGKDLTFFARE